MIIFRKKKDYLKAKKMIQNSINNGNIDKRIIGTNAKMSELHAAWGLTLLKKLNRIISKKRSLFKTYKNELMRKAIIPLNNLAENNFSYLPIIFKSERKLKKINNELIKKNIVCRRYFFPSLKKHC
jgi:dTDP-4-amino-4,6-dideoxygalactose transaminase